MWCFWGFWVWGCALDAVVVGIMKICYEIIASDGLFSNLKG